MQLVWYSLGQRAGRRSQARHRGAGAGPAALMGDGGAGACAGRVEPWAHVPFCSQPPSLAVHTHYPCRAPFSWLAMPTVSWFYLKKIGVEESARCRAGLCPSRQAGRSDLCLAGIHFRGDCDVLRLGQGTFGQCTSARGL